MTPNSSPSVTPPRPPRPARRGRWLLLLVPLVLGVGGLLLSVGLIRPGPGAADSSAPGSGVSSSDGAQAAPPSRGPARPSALPAPPQAALSPEEAGGEALRQLWEMRLARDRFTLDSYRQSTRYPHE
ncbi:MAG TPA: hypothetical protein VEU33_30235, partial [Archangium sp.]|nr:hypothetical protein [Archangium sp.]